MREIKFRGIIENDIFLAKSAKQLGDKKISYTIIYFDFNDILRRDLLFSERELLIPYFQRNMVKINQYTGLKDKNSNEIYEGDILKTQWRLEIVKWDFEKLNRLNGFKDFIEIIGNIYESPELLENNQ